MTSYWRPASATVATMNPVGIIANPASGKDIRRLVASGTVITNQEKINIIVRMIKAMDSLGIDNVYVMPDPGHLADRVISNLEGELTNTTVAILDLPYTLGTYKDSLNASAMMCERGFAAIIVMGGDGTSRVVSKACGDVPLIPVSTGTNNVFPQMVEGTLAGLAAGVIATQKIPLSKSCRRAPVLELRNEANELVDTALVDIAVVDANDIGARAVWDPRSIKELFLTRAHPAEIGLSSIGGWLDPVEPHTEEGLYIALNEHGETTVTAPIAPGLLCTVNVQSHKRFTAGAPLPITHTPCAIALDGEREIVLRKGERMTVTYNCHGPLVGNLSATLVEAANVGLMRNNQPAGHDTTI